MKFKKRKKKRLDIKWQEWATVNESGLYEVVVVKKSVTALSDNINSKYQQ